MALLLAGLLLAVQDPVRLELYDIKDLQLTEAMIRDLGVPAIENGESWSLQNGLLVLRGTPETHQKVRDYLTMLRDSQEILFKVRLFESAESLGDVPSRIQRLDARGREALNEKLGRLLPKKLEEFSLPVYEHRTASVFIGGQNPFVRDHVLHLEEGKAPRAEPVVDHITTGLSLSLRGSLTKDGALNLSEANLFFVDLSPGGIPQVETPLGRVGRPEARKADFRIRTAPLAPSEALLVGPLARPFAAKEAPGIWLLMEWRVVKKE